MKVIAKYVTLEEVNDFMLDGDDFTNAYKERSVSNG